MTGNRSVYAPAKRRHQLLFAKRTYRTPPCRENVRDAAGRWAECGQPRYQLAGATMGVCQSCFERTRPVNPINLERKRHADTESKT